jgi:hypothetical protein
VRTVVIIDNTQCEKEAKELKVKLFRDIRAVSSNGSEFIELTELGKRKIKETFSAK